MASRRLAIDGTECTTAGDRQITREMEMLKSPTAVFSTIENRYYIAKFLLKIDFLEEFKSTIKAELNAAEMVMRIQSTRTHHAERQGKKTSS